MLEKLDKLRRDGRCYAGGEHLKTVKGKFVVIERDWIYVSDFRWIRPNFFVNLPKGECYITVAWYKFCYNLIDYHEL